MQLSSGRQILQQANNFFFLLPIVFLLNPKYTSNSSFKFRGILSPSLVMFHLTLFSQFLPLRFLSAEKDSTKTFLSFFLCECKYSNIFSKAGNTFLLPDSSFSILFFLFSLKDRLFLLGQQSMNSVFPGKLS